MTEDEAIQGLISLGTTPEEISFLTKISETQKKYYPLFQALQENKDEANIHRLARFLGIKANSLPKIDTIIYSDPVEEFLLFGLIEKSVQKQEEFYKKLDEFFYKNLEHKDGHYSLAKKLLGE